jgi:O-antigen/teichoic acid export membrane protein
LVAAVVATSLSIDLATAIVAAAFIPIINQGQLWRSYAVSRHHLMRPAASGAIGAGLRVALIATLAALGLLSTFSAITVIQFATAAGVVIALGWYVLHTYPHTGDHATHAHYLDHLRRGSPILVFAALTSVTLRADLFFLNDLVDPSTLGVYAAASALSMSVLAVSGAFKSRIQSAVFRPGARRAVYLELAVVLAVGLVGATIAAILSPWLVAVLLGPGYESAVPILRILAFASAALLILDSVHGLLAALGMRKMMLVVAGVGASVTLISLPLLISIDGASGAAWATVISYSLASVIGLFIVRSALNRDRPGDERAQPRVTLD